VSSNNNNKVKVEIEKERETLEALIRGKKLFKNMGEEGFESDL
jgi:hypothetical protein